MENQKKYLIEKGFFEPKCNLKVFVKEEIDLLKKFGHWYQGLSNGDLKPENEAQRHFINVVKVNAEPWNIHEFVWRKYLKRMEIEKNKGTSLNKIHEIEEDPFYSREGAKNLKRNMFGVVNQAHRK